MEEKFFYNMQVLQGENVEWQDVLGDTLINRLKKHVILDPNKIAYIFLQDGINETTKISYAELDKKARCIATFLQQHQLVGERILLPFSAGLEFIVAFIGCLYAKAIAVPVICPNKHNLHQSVPLIKNIINDCMAKAILSTVNFLSFQDVFALPNDLLVIDISAVEEKLAEFYLPCDINPNVITHLQYTSGSTSTPKGVITTHANLTHSLTHTIEAWDYSQDSITLTWTAHTHVYGLIAGLLVPLFHGTPSVIMPSEIFIAHPIYWLRAISKYHITHSGSPNFGYELCLHQIAEDQLKDINLSSWKVVVNGGEVVQEKTLKEFAERFKTHGFRLQSFCPAYGMSEATGLISCKVIGSQPTFYNLDLMALNENQVLECYSEQSRGIVSCGPPLEGMSITIMDSKTQKETQLGNIGEIWLSGLSCSPGYWSNKSSEQKLSIFSTTLAKNVIKTGDLGFMKNGEIILTGRLKDIMIIFGKNYYPFDIESSVSNSHPCLQYKSNVAFSIQQENKEVLILIQEVDDFLMQISYNELQRIIRSAIIIKHGIDVNDIIFVASGTIPKTNSGKIQRALSRQYYQSQDFKRLYWKNREIQSIEI